MVVSSLSPYMVGLSSGCGIEAWGHGGIEAKRHRDIEARNSPPAYRICGPPRTAYASNKVCGDPETRVGDKVIV